MLIDEFFRWSTLCLSVPRAVSVAVTAVVAGVAAAGALELRVGVTLRAGVALGAFVALGGSLAVEAAASDDCISRGIGFLLAAAEAEALTVGGRSTRAARGACAIGSFEAAGLFFLLAAS